MAELYVYQTHFEPILLPGMQARLITESDKIDIECIAVGGLPEYIKDFGALTAAAWDTDNEDTNLEMSTNEFSQLRMRIVDDIQLRFNNLSATRQWRTSKTSFTLRMYSSYEEEFMKEYMFKASEFFVYEDHTPRFDFYCDVASTTSKVAFSGWRFKVKEITGVKPTKVIWVSGWPSGAEGI